MDELINRLERVSQRLVLRDIFAKVFEEQGLDAYISELNTDGQLYFGIRSDGSAIEPPYTKMTITKKLKRGQPVNRVTLKDTGRFYASFRAIVLQDGSIDIDATDSKIDDLEAKYGDKITGLTAENLDKLRKRILDGFEKVVKRDVLQL